MFYISPVFIKPALCYHAPMINLEKTFASLALLVTFFGFTLSYAHAERCVFEGTTTLWRNVTNAKAGCYGHCPYYAWEKLKGGAESEDECIAFGISECQTLKTSGVVKLGSWLSEKNKTRIDYAQGCQVIEE